MNNSESDSFLFPHSQMEAPSQEYTDGLLLHKGTYADTWRFRRNGNFLLLKIAHEEQWCQDLLRREYELSVGLSHPNIASTYAFDSIPQLGVALIMEYVDGATLAQLLSQNPTKSERMKWWDELLSVVEYLHRKGIVHRDLKLENILISASGGYLKLIDFGLSDDDAHYMLSHLGGTPEYAAPELVERTDIVDVRSDIYSLGVILSKMFPAQYRSIIKRCTQPHPNDRYRDIGQLRKAFNNRQRIRIFTFAASLLIITLSVLYFPIMRARPVMQAKLPTDSISVAHSDSTQQKISHKGTTELQPSIKKQDNTKEKKHPIESVDIDTSSDSLFSGLVHINSQEAILLQLSGQSENAAAYIALPGDMVDSGLRYRLLKKPNKKSSGRVQLTMSANNKSDTLIIPTAIKRARNTYKVVSIAFDAFSYRDDIHYVKLPGPLKKIGNYAFNKSSIDSLDASEAVLKSIGDEAFAQSAIRHLTLSQEQGEIGIGAFESNSSLQSVVLNGTIRISYRAFSYCRSLRKVNLPATIQQIGYSAFSGCSLLESLKVEASIPPTIIASSSEREYFLDRCDPSRLRIFVPQEALSAYAQAEGWKNFASCLFPIE